MVDWKKIHTVLLDMDGTLLDLHFDNYFWLQHLPKRYADIHEHDEQTAQQKLEGLIEAERGTLNWYCLDYWSNALQVDIPELKREVEHLIRIRPFVLEFLQQLRSSAKQILLVTNAHRKSLDLKMHRTGIESLFDEVVVSHDYQRPKEHPEFWQQLQGQHPFNPATTLLIDDTPSVLKAAQDFGIQHLLTLIQPDSQQAKREQTDFPGILHFDEIMPISQLSL